MPRPWLVEYRAKALEVEEARQAIIDDHARQRVKAYLWPTLLTPGALQYAQDLAVLARGAVENLAADHEAMELRQDATVAMVSWLLEVVKTIPHPPDLPPWPPA